MAGASGAEQRWLSGRRVIVTAGGTREPIDPVRFLGNRSSGKMGNALASAALNAGADVTLITAAEPPGPQPEPGESRGGGGLLTVVRVDTADEMGNAVREALPGAALLLMAAAVADYRPVFTSPRKIKKGDGPWLLELAPTNDILASLRDLPDRDGVFVVGFAAETTDLLENAQAKLRDKGLDLIVLNDVSRTDIAMGADANEVTVIGHDGIAAHIERSPKQHVAAEILGVIRSRMQ